MSSVSSADLVMADRLIEANGAREIFEDVEKGQMHTALQAAYVSLQSALDLVQSKAGLSEAPSEAELTQQHAKISPSERELVDKDFVTDLEKTGSSQVYAPRRGSLTYTGASFQAGPRHHPQPTASASNWLESIGSLEMASGSFSRYCDLICARGCKTYQTPREARHKWKTFRIAFSHSCVCVCV